TTAVPGIRGQGTPFSRLARPRRRPLRPVHRSGSGVLVSLTLNAPTTNRKLLEWVEEVAALCEPETIHWFDGSDEEFELLSKQPVAGGTFVALDPPRGPGSFWATTDPSDVARVEDRTFICAEREADAGPTNHWIDPTEMRAKLHDLFGGS